MSGSVWIYLAAPWQRRLEMVGCAEDCRRAGYAITSRWLYIEHDTLDGECDPTKAAHYAVADLEDIDRAAAVIAFTDGKPARGGFMHEFGYAQGRGKILALVGPRQHVFHHHGHVHQFNDWSACLAALKTGKELAWTR